MPLISFRLSKLKLSKSDIKIIPSLRQYFKNELHFRSLKTSKIFTDVEGDNIAELIVSLFSFVD